MTFQLRPYQREAADAVIDHLKTSIEPIFIEAATGAGKSVILAEISRAIHKMTGKRVLCTAPSAELVVQNSSKYKALGEPCSLYSASAGAKSLRHPTVFGTPLTIKGRISSFKNNFALIVIDECDQLTPTLLSIIDAMREGNPNLRIVGLTATPYRLGSGYIFREWANGEINGEDVARNPFFSKMVYQIGAHQLIEDGYLTRPVIGQINAPTYDTKGMIANAAGNFKPSDIDRAYHGQGRKSAAIVADIVAQSRGRRGVLIYAATVQHAKEIMESLPPEISAIITGETKNRKEILDRLKSQKIKYIVNVGVLTVGIDVPHVDVIAILRKSSSIRLIQQIIGRGLRLYEGKDDCLVLDYTTNLEEFCPDGDLFKPIVKAAKISGGHGSVKALCPDCGYENEFGRHKDYIDFNLDENGYCLDVFGAQLMSEFGPVPGHYGRRCFGMIQSHERGKYERCNSRWTSKECPHCAEPNDLAARYCIACRGEIVDPGEKLISDFRAMKKDPSRRQTDKVLSLETSEGISKNGNRTIRADFVTEYRQFSCWFQPDATHTNGQRDYRAFMGATMFGEVPKTVTYKKDPDTGFFIILAYNKEPDMEPAFP